ncbi:MAG: tripartite tricarboxylate transporter TctB family protein [Proteobacteria bacterium]|nr:tripartite tricarboxylate transporter TctB family protein [Pseudomonadota bacterium]
MISRATAEIVFAGFTALFGVVIAHGAREFGVGWSASGPEPGTFPFYIGAIITLASLANLAGALRGRWRGAEPFMTAQQGGALLRFIVPMVLFVIAAIYLGLYVATALYMFGVMVVQGRYRIWYAALVAIGMPVALFLLLEKGFQVSLLKGPLEAALGY